MQEALILIVSRLSGASLKLLFISNEYPPAAAGGIGVVLRGLCEALAQRGHEIHVVGCYPIAHHLMESLGGVRVHRLPGRTGRMGLIANRLALYLQIRRIASKGAIDIIEAPDFEAPSSLLPRQSKKRVVRLHGSHVYFASERCQRRSTTLGWLEKMALCQADAWVSVSEYTARLTQALFKVNRPVHVIYNAAHVPGRFPRKADYSGVQRAVYFGTLAEKKGVFTLARAWTRFQASHPDWILSVFGRDAQHDGRSVREQMIEILGEASSSVEFCGSVANDELLHRLSSFDFAVLPSFSEAFAMAPMEAMALGVPVIYSKASSGPELMEHGVDGWLADPSDDLQLAQLMEEVADDPENRERVGRTGREKIETFFSHEKFVNRNLEVYNCILGLPGDKA